jgi:glycogen operon protein
MAQSSRPYPLGASWDGNGTNFALFSAHAEKVELCLFDSAGRREIRRIELPERSEDVWHGYFRNVFPGQLYGYRVYGPYTPEQGHRFNHHKLLIDPYARKLSGAIAWSDAHFGYRTTSRRADLSFDRRDSARGMPKAVVVEEAFTWRQESNLRIPWEDMIIYEAHVKGLTQLRGDVSPPWRGKLRGLGSHTVIDHLKRLGVTTLELLPIQAFIDDRHLVQKGLRNYWGYNTLNFFSVEARYGGEAGMEGFRTMVSRLHDAGIEVILDVVYNHTAEGNHLGPTLSFRGIDNASYYWLKPDQMRYYDDFTGTGNALNLSHPRVAQMVMDSLRYWVRSGHVDGFRFDLATTLCRMPDGFNTSSPFLAACAQDPVLSGVKLIAEPWDVGPGGYQVGHFPPAWSEWNDHYRRTLRRYWAGEGSLIGDLSSAMTGSSHLFKHSRRGPRASINHITVHDGFTLADLVSYNQKHNEANGEDNRDGSDDNQSSNWGVEGPTDDPEITDLRNRIRRNQLACLMLAHGIPLILAGDEVGNSQAGNNNAYCQDNETGWVDWSGTGKPGTDLTGFIGRLADIRSRYPQLRPKRWVQGRAKNGDYGVIWLTPQGSEMTQADWGFPDGHFLSYLLAPPEPEEPTLFIVLNAASIPVTFVLPKPREVAGWQAILDTAEPEATARQLSPGAKMEAPDHAILVYASVPS